MASPGYLVFSGLKVPVVGLSLDKGHIVVDTQIPITKPTVIKPGSYALFDGAGVLVGVGSTQIKDLDTRHRNLIKGDTFHMQVIITVGQTHFTSIP